MRPVIALYSYHHGNTEKLANAFAKTLDAEVKTPQRVEEQDFGRIIGFGSGIYGGRHHASLLGLADRLPPVKGRSVFIFSTMGIPFGDGMIQSAVKASHSRLREKLTAKGYVVAGEFSCAGFNTNSILQSLGGVNKGRPNEADLERAREFALGLKEKLQPSP